MITINGTTILDDQQLDIGPALSRAITPIAATWQTTPPPKDRLIIIVASVIYEDGYGGSSTPYTGTAIWQAAEGWGNYWAHDEEGMSITRHPNERLRIHEWIDFPPMEAIPGETITA